MVRAAGPSGLWCRLKSHLGPTQNSRALQANGIQNAFTGTNSAIQVGGSQHRPARLGVSLCRDHVDDK